MKKKDILMMSSEGVFNYFYPTLTLLSEENEKLKIKVKQQAQEIQMLEEANDNLKDMLDDSKNRDYNLKLDKIIKILEENKKD